MRSEIFSLFVVIFDILIRNYFTAQNRYDLSLSSTGSEKEQTSIGTRGNRSDISGRDESRPYR